ncbi:DUF2058 family protein [Arenimonas sp. GDDSR-1]|uniref:DUF2058 domain-containing protein n=1 Tax=Arenimonas sp. GDDSR-1 TaxID=2950125 RepID=UPI002602E90E|nr:DUF2058 family protein [Arenimonas sp. GDDSR-1]
MSNSLKDQLLGLGFKQAPKPERKPDAQVRPHSAPTQPKSAGRNRNAGKPKPRQSREEIDLAKAFALRTQQEKRERDLAEQAKQVASQQKKIAKEQVSKLLEGGILNAADADIARHFSYGGKIKRIYVTGDQLGALNAGDLGVVQFNGRYCLTSRETVLAVRALLPSLVALYCDGDEESLPEGYDDPKFQIPDDLVW